MFYTISVDRDKNHKCPPGPVAQVPRSTNCRQITSRKLYKLYTNIFVYFF